jgi:hypothetical protein
MWRHLPVDKLAPRLFFYISAGLFGTTLLLQAGLSLHTNGRFWYHRSRANIAQAGGAVRIRISLQRPLSIKGGQFPMIRTEFLDAKIQVRHVPLSRPCIPLSSSCSTCGQFWTSHKPADERDCSRAGQGVGIEELSHSSRKKRAGRSVILRALNAIILPVVRRDDGEGG